MKDYKVIETQEKVPVNYKCDRCGVFSEDGFNPYIETFKIQWGYGSNFDLEEWEFDLCEDCIKEKLQDVNVKIKDYLK
jgi:hypothetical protein